MRLTVGSLPAGVYWRRRAVVAAAVALVIILFVVMCGSPDTSVTGDKASPTPGRSGPFIPDLPTSAAATTDGATPTADPSGSGGATAGTGGDDGADNGGSSDGGNGGNGDGGGAPPVVATVPCADAEIALTAQVSPSPGIYGGVITLTLVVRNTADHACLRDVGSAPQELQVRQGTTVIWSSDHCNTPQASDVRAFGPNIESRFSLRWNTYRVDPHECDPPAGVTPAAAGSYTVVARLGTKLSAPVAFDIQR